ncbi:hypothetical protein T07_13375 [Trichinella nelsoni]|uniref:Uncharacterized protein n=1 Tax=Trichinella nelsoni TaxID=6336 RepID=A0A0V0S714_9BILA|nr:hypothetical protein T07_13375 [Trichinella nelsoni]
MQDEGGVPQFSCLSIELHSKDKFHFVIWTQPHSSNRYISINYNYFVYLPSCTATLHASCVQTEVRMISNVAFSLEKQFPYAASKNTTFKEKRSKERMNWQCMFSNSFRYEIQHRLDNLTLSVIHGCIDYYGEKWICESDAQTVHQLSSSVIRFLQLVGLNQNEMV